MTTTAVAGIQITRAKEAPGEASFKVEVAPERVERAESKAAQEIAKRTRLPGRWIRVCTGLLAGGECPVAESAPPRQHYPTQSGRIQASGVEQPPPADEVGRQLTNLA